MAFYRTKHDPEMDYFPLKASLPHLLKYDHSGVEKTQPGREQICTAGNRDGQKGVLSRDGERLGHENVGWQHRESESEVICIAVYGEMFSPVLHQN